MPLSPRKNGLDALFKEVRVFKEGGSGLENSPDVVSVYCLLFFASYLSSPLKAQEASAVQSVVIGCGHVLERVAEQKQRPNRQRSPRRV